VSLSVTRTYAAFTNHAFVLRETVAVARLLIDGASWSEGGGSVRVGMLMCCLFVFGG